MTYKVKYVMTVSQVGQVLAVKSVIPTEVARASNSTFTSGERLPGGGSEQRR